MPGLGTPAGGRGSLPSAPGRRPRSADWTDRRGPAAEEQHGRWWSPGAVASIRCGGAGEPIPSPVRKASTAFGTMRVAAIMAWKPPITYARLASSARVTVNHRQSGHLEGNCQITVTQPRPRPWTAGGGGGCDTCHGRQLPPTGTPAKLVDTRHALASAGQAGGGRSLAAWRGRPRGSFQHPDQLLGSWRFSLAPPKSVTLWADIASPDRRVPVGVDAGRNFSEVRCCARGFSWSGRWCETTGWRKT